MSIEREDTDECDEVRAELSEFALGTLTGRERSMVLKHLASCRACRAELDSLTAVSDALIALAPATEPPLGFELRLMQKYRDEGVSRRAQRRHRIVGLVGLVAAAVILSALGFVVGTAVTAHHTTSQPVAAGLPGTAQLTSRGHVVGHVFVSAGRPTWIYMTFEDARLVGSAWCRVTLKNGVVKDVGSFSLTRGYGAWAAAIDVAGSQVRSAQVTNDSGAVLATATLST